MNIELYKLIAYRDGLLDASERQELERHLAESEEWRKHVVTLEQMTASIQSHFAANPPSQTLDCPDEFLWLRFLNDELSESDRESLQTHLYQCDYCFRVVAWYRKEQREAVGLTPLPMHVHEQIEVSGILGRKSPHRFRDALNKIEVVWALPRWAYAVAGMVVVLFAGWFTLRHAITPEPSPLASRLTPDSPPLAKRPGEAIRLTAGNYQLLHPAIKFRTVNRPTSISEWQQWHDTLWDQRQLTTAEVTLTDPLKTAIRMLGESVPEADMNRLLDAFETQGVAVPPKPIIGVILEQRFIEQIIEGRTSPNQQLAVTFLTSDEIGWMAVKIEPVK